MKNPIQPLEKDANGVMRFKENVLVIALLTHAQKTGSGLFKLERDYHKSEHADDWQQLAQLIGYSLGGYEELSYVSNDSYGVAAKMVEEGLGENEARIACLEHELSVIHSSLREPTEPLTGQSRSNAGLGAQTLKNGDGKCSTKRTQHNGRPVIWSFTI